MNDDRDYLLTRPVMVTVVLAGIVTAILIATGVV